MFKLPGVVARRRSTLLVMALIGVGLVSCRSDRADDAGGGAGASAAWLVGPPGKDRAATRDYITKSVKFGGKSEADSAFTAPFACPGCPTDPMMLTVVPEEKSYKVDWNEAFRNSKNRGYVVAMIYNGNSEPYPPLQLQANDSAYVWVGPVNDDGSDRAVAYYKINSGTGEATGPMNPYRTITYCDDPKWEERTKAAAKLDHPHDATRCYDATYSPANAAPPRTASTATVSFASAMFRANGMWLACVYGCCEVGATTMVTMTHFKPEQ